MARKKQTKTSPTKASKNAAKSTATAPAAPAAEPHMHTHEHCSHELACLTGEVQTFLSKRDELAEKLAREIDATEKKLAELKHAAAMLYPDKEEAPYVESESTNNLIGLR